MLPIRADAPPEGEEWLHELDYDGHWLRIAARGGEGRAFGPTGKDLTRTFRPLAEAAAALGAAEALIDGVAIVQDEAGRPDAAALEAAIARAPERLVFMAFDLLRLDGRDLRARPVEERRARLEALIGANDPGFAIQYGAHVDGGGAAFFRAAGAIGLRGVVSKRKGSRYRTGPSKNWVAARVLAAPAVAAAPKPIAGTAKKGGEPSYKKPKLPEQAALAAYYEATAPLLLEHAGRRPLNLFRCTAGYCFFQRNRAHPASGEAFASPIRFLPVAQKNKRTEEYLWVDDEAGVAACVAADAVEFHGWGSLVDAVERPDRIAFDLDPGEGLGFEAVKAAAFTLRRVLDALGLRSWPLLSGGKGVHVVVPLEPEAEWEAVRAFAHRICAGLAKAEPALYTVALPKAERRGRIFLDYLRNQRTATAILPWSLRARAGAPVAAPVSWGELGEMPGASVFTIADAALLLRRGRSRALKGWGKVRQRLPGTI
jgi:DNA ligase D-like protein (predicted polymerase)